MSAQDKWGKLAVLMRGAGMSTSPGTHRNTTLVEVDALALEGWIVIDAVGDENIYFRRAGGERCFCKVAL